MRRVSPEQTKKKKIQSAPKRSGVEQKGRGVYVIWSEARLQNQARGGLGKNDGAARPVPFSELFDLPKTSVKERNNTNRKERTGLGASYR